MKKLIFIFSFLAVTLSCESYLDEENIANVTADSYYATSTGVEDAVRATYG